MMIDWARAEGIAVACREFCWPAPSKSTVKGTQNRVNYDTDEPLGMHPTDTEDGDEYESAAFKIGHQNSMRLVLLKMRPLPVVILSVEHMVRIS